MTDVPTILAPPVAYGDDDLDDRARSALNNAAADGLTLEFDSCKTGYRGVILHENAGINKPKKKKPYQFRVREVRSGSRITRTGFATAEEAAVARARLLQTKSFYP